MIGRLVVADQKIAMLIPIQSDHDLIKKWDKSYAAHGLNLLNTTLYFDLIRELAAISLDKDRTSPSIKNILQLLESNALLEHLKNDYIKPLPITWLDGVDEDSKRFWEERHQEREHAENSEKFNKLYSSAKNGYKELKDSELFKKIKDTRNKLVAHYEMRGDGDTPKMLDPSDIGLKWGDAEEYFEKIKPIITNLVLLISNEGYALDIYRSEHIKIANDFWYK